MAGVPNKTIFRYVDRCEIQVWELTARQELVNPELKLADAKTRKAAETGFIKFTLQVIWRTPNGPTQGGQSSSKFRVNKYPHLQKSQFFSGLKIEFQSTPHFSSLFRTKATIACDIPLRHPPLGWPDTEHEAHLLFSLVIREPWLKRRNAPPWMCWFKAFAGYSKLLRFDLVATAGYAIGCRSRWRSLVETAGLLLRCEGFP